MIDWRNLPPLSALRAFSAFAETDSLEAAGARIGVTHAAISQQIRALEAQLNLTLVERGGRRLQLSSDGRRLAETLASSFAAIAETLAELTGAEADRPLRITTTSTFAGGWLLPRLPDFRAQHPGIDLVIDPTPVMREIGREVDVAVRYGKGNWAGLESQLILRSGIVVVAPPHLGPPGPVPLQDLAGLPWLQELGTTEASAFLDQLGLRREQGVGMTSLPANLVLDAARDGQGVAIMVRAFVAADLAAGRLRVLFEEEDEDEGYFLVLRPGVQRPPVQAFCRWILRQAAEAGKAKHI